MKKGIAFLVGFVAGMVIGGRLTTTKKEISEIDKILDESEQMLNHIKDENEQMLNRINVALSDEELEYLARDSETLAEAINIMREKGYAKTVTIESFNRTSPYLIDDNAFAEFDNYEAISLTYFADGILTDEDYEIIKDPSYLVGDFKQYFKDDVDVIYIRCDERCADYEIARDIRTYAEVYNTLPHMKWRNDE